MRNIRIRTKNGFSILAIILVIVAVIVAIGVWALSGSANTSNSGSASNDIAVSTLLNDSSALKLAWDTLIINGESPQNITMVVGDNSTYNMLNSNTGTEQHQVNPKALRSDFAEPEGMYVLAKNYAVNSNGSYDYTLVVAGIKDSVCTKINQQINGTDTIPKSASVPNSAGFVTGATKANPMTNVAIDFHSQTLANDWGVGCVGTANPDNNVFYRVLKMN